MDLKAIEALIASLNEDQLRVVEIGPGATYVGGQPGSGKTTTVVARIARMVRDGLDPRYILAMTFTRNAAQEMNERLTALGVVGGRVGTIHSLSLNILQESLPSLVGVLRLDESGFKLKQLLRQTLNDLRRDKIIDRNAKPDLDAVERYIGCMKAGGLCPTFGNPFGVNEEATERLYTESRQHFHATGLGPGQLVSLFEHLEQRRAAAGLYDFDDMQLWAFSALVTMPEVRTVWQRYSIVIVDESQDSSRIQWDVARILAGGASRMYPDRTSELPEVPPVLTAVGQASQSLYSWRAAVPQWLVDFATTKGVGFFTLPLNYRSGPEICDVCTKLVEKEEWHLEGKVVPACGGEPTVEGYKQTFELTEYQDLSMEVSGILDRIEARCEGDWTRGVVMARLAMALHLVEIECIRRQIPYEKRASGAFFDAKEIQDLLAYLRVAGGWDRPDRMYMRRCIRVPFRYIGKNALDWASSEVRRTGETDFLGTLMQAPMLSGRQVRSLKALEETLEQLESMILGKASPADCLRFVIDDTMYYDWLREEGGAMRIDASKIAVIEHLLAIGDAMSSVQAFVSQIDSLAAGIKVGRQQSQRQQGNRLVLTTVHRAKGLQWEHVGIIDVADGRFPWNKGFSPDEELRLLFVAVSRAMKTVSVSCSGAPSKHFTRLERLTDAVVPMKATDVQGAKECQQQP